MGATCLKERPTQKATMDARTGATMTVGCLACLCPVFWPQLCYHEAALLYMVNSPQQRALKLCGHVDAGLSLQAYSLHVVAT